MLENRSKQEYAVLEVYSEMNSWLDCIFIVYKEDEDKATQVLGEAYSRYFDEDENDDTPYGDYFKRFMDEAGIEYDLFYHEDEEDD